MYDPRSIANEVSRWTSLGVKLPKELAEAVTVFETLVYTEVGYPPVFDIAEVTATNAEALIKEFADQLVLAESPGGGASPLQKAKNIAVEAAARSVNSLARVAIPEVIEQLTPEFNQHADAYIAAVRKLPGDPEVNAGQRSTTTLSERLVAAGPEAVAAYGEAQREALYLNGISSWVAGTGRLSGAGDTDVALRILRPSTYFDLKRIDDARQRLTNDPAIQAIDPVLYAAALGGVEFGINTVAEGVAIRTSLEQAAVKSLAWK